ncbi:MAG: lytic transglycosylase domain-containing protein [Spirochaetes bacterium]|nr:lytic transglycosylase domain-containing protein [Spirochaetota bacterium]
MKISCSKAVSRRLVSGTALIVFFLLFFACAQTQIQPAQPYFYQGLLSRADGNNEAVRYFEKALDSPNIYVRQAAAAALGSLMLDGIELSGAVLERVSREASGSWAKAFNALGKGSPGSTPDKQKVLALLLSSSTPREVALFLLRECRHYSETFFSEAETAAIDGRLAASRSYFRGALRFFQIVLESDSREMFFQYPDLINDLGRAFQFAASTNEGLELFLRWEREIAGVHSSETSGIRYRLLFNAAQIARQRGLVEQAIDLFEQALALAPNSAQINACIWRILDLAIRRGPVFFISKLEQYVNKLHDVAYLDAILDRFSRELLLQRDWNNMLRTFQIIQHLENSLSVSRYAWIIARAIEEKYLSAEELQQAAAVINALANEDLAMAYKRIVFNNGDTSFYIRSVMAAYYRSVSAAALGKNFFITRERVRRNPRRNARAGTPSPALEFFLGFFDNNAARFVPRYIRDMESLLTADELRTIAASLVDAGLYVYAIRLAASYTGRDGHILNRQDMEFLYPASSYRGLIERFAREYGLDPAIFFGLIRTESAFQRAIVSHAGAIGLSQLMPSTAEDMANRIRRSGGPDYFLRRDSRGRLNFTDPELNLHIGAFYLNHLIERFDDTLLALLAYNGGQGRVRRWWNASNLPPDLFMETIEIRETREYGRRVLGAAAIYRALYFTK